MRSSTLLGAGLLGLVVFACGSERDFKDPEAEGMGGDGPGGDGDEGMGGDRPGGDGDGDGDLGGGGDPVSGPMLSISTEELPAGSFNQPYSVAIEAASSEGDELIFSVSGGALPEGLSLSSDGVLSGTPLDDGEFSFTITVEAGELSEEVELTLTVTRKRWLAYASSEDNVEVTRLYLIDTSLPSLPKTLVSTGISDGIGVISTNYKFAPNGSKLGFIAERTADGPNQLFVVDTSGDSLSAAREITTGGRAEALAFSADGTWIAYLHRAVDETGENFITYALDLEDPEAEPIPLGTTASFGAVQWVGNDYVIHNIETAPYAVSRRNDGGFASPVEITQTGALIQVDHENSLVQFQNLWPTGCGRDTALVELATSTSHPAPGDGSYTRWPAYNPQLSLVSVRTTVDAVDQYDIFPSTDVGGEILGSIGPSHISVCTQIYWNPAGNRLLTLVDNTGSGGVITTVTPDFGSTAIPGTYGHIRDAQWRDDDRLVFSTNGALHHVDTDADPISEPAELDLGLQGTSPIDWFRVAPNGSQLVYSGDSDTEGQREPYIVSLADGFEGAPVRLLDLGDDDWPQGGNGGYGFEGPFTGAAWSKDSSIFAVRVQSVVTNGTAHRFLLVRALEDEPVAEEMHDYYCYANGCQSTRSFLFQP